MCSVKHIHVVYIQLNCVNNNLCATLQEQRWITPGALESGGEKKIAREGL